MIISCTDVGRTYGTGRLAVVAVYGVTCEIRAGDRIAIMGPSGSGKSTLLHLLAGLETPTAGQLDWHGNPARTDLGVVFQAPTLIPSLNVLENVQLPLLLADVGAAESRDRARAALTRLGLDGLGSALPQELSGGQAQRVVIARVLAQRPTVVLADEPTSQLDRANADHVADVLLEVADETGAALVVATHDPAIACRLGQIWPIADGRLRRLEDEVRA